jgi:hypothetical protein
MNIDTFTEMLKVVQKQMEQVGVYSVMIDTKNSGISPGKIGALVVHDEEYAKIYGAETEIISVDGQYKRSSKTVNDVEFYTYKKEIRATKDTDNENTHTEILPQREAS